MKSSKVSFFIPSWQNIAVFSRFACDQMVRIKISEVSASMALTTFLAIVPVLALSLAIFSAFPAFADTRQAIDDLIVGLLPQQYSETLIEHIKQFMSHAAGLTTFGLLGFLITALMLIHKLFQTVNALFEMPKNRPLLQRVLIYWGMITVGPLMVAVSISVSARAFTYALEGIDGGIASFFYWFGQTMLKALFYAAIYKCIPDCEVKFRHALIGGLVVSVFGSIVKSGFEYYVMSGTMANIYGAFVAIPVLVLWIYVTWILFFVGASITATIPKVSAGRLKDNALVGNHFLSGLVMLKHLVMKRVAGQTPAMSLKDLSHVAGISPVYARLILDKLAMAGYVAAVKDRSVSEPYALVCDTRTMTLQAAFERFLINGNNSIVLSENSDPAHAQGQLRHWWGELLKSPCLTLPLREVLFDEVILDFEKNQSSRSDKTLKSAIGARLRSLGKTKEKTVSC